MVVAVGVVSVSCLRIRGLCRRRVDVRRDVGRGVVLGAVCRGSGGARGSVAPAVEAGRRSLVAAEGLVGRLCRGRDDGVCAGAPLGVRWARRREAEGVAVARWRGSVWWRGVAAVRAAWCLSGSGATARVGGVAEWAAVAGFRRRSWVWPVVLVAAVGAWASRSRRRSGCGVCPDAGGRVVVRVVGCGLASVALGCGGTVVCWRRVAGACPRGGASVGAGHVAWWWLWVG